MARDALHLTPLDGVGYVGGATVHVSQEEDRGLLLDCGAVFGRADLVLGPDELRPHRGLHDLWDVGLLPRVHGPWRGDVCEEVGPHLLWPHRPVEAVLASHAHGDHVSRIGCLHPRVEVHGTAATLALMRLQQDAGRDGFLSELVAARRHGPCPRTDRGYAKVGNAETMRPLFLADRSPSAELTRYLVGTAGGPSPRRSPMKAAGMEYECWPVCHSLPACGFVLHTKVGPIAFTGDCRLHGRNADKTLEFFERLHDLRLKALLIEATRLGRENDERITEEDAANGVLAAVRQARGRLVVGIVPSRHLERLEAFVNAAEATCRTLLIDPRMAAAAHVVALADGGASLLEHPSVALFDDPRKTKPSAWQQAAREVLGGRAVSPEEVRRHPGRYVLMSDVRSRMSWLRLVPRGSVLVYSGSSAYSAMDVERHRSLGEVASLLAMPSKGISWDRQGRTSYPDRLSSSGHLMAAEIAEAVRKIRPKNVVPLHSDVLERFEPLVKGIGAKVVLPTNDQPILIG